MIRFFAHRFFVALVRLAIVWWLLAVVAEIAIRMKAGESTGHVWDVFKADGFPEDFGARFAATFRVLTICWVTVMIFGLGIGIFRARLRRAKILEALWLPLIGVAWAPAFWLVGLVVLWLVESWGHPGFADGAAPIGEFATISPWWHASILGLILAVGAISWQFRVCSAGIRDEAKQGFLRASFMRGHKRSIIFYDHILRNSMPALTGVLDRGLPATLGMLAIAEWAFRYPGLGQFLVESARERIAEPVFLVGAIFASIAVLAKMFSEWFHGILDRRVMTNASLT